MKPPYYSIHGNQEEGWNVMLYEWVPNNAAPDGNNPSPDKLTTRQGWTQRRFFESFDEVIKLVSETEKVEE